MTVHTQDAEAGALFPHPAGGNKEAMQAVRTQVARRELAQIPQVQLISHVYRSEGISKWTR